MIQKSLAEVKMDGSGMHFGVLRHRGLTLLWFAALEQKQENQLVKYI
jgi:hypothetical protein